jgi:hypothetical protein
MNNFNFDLEYSTKKFRNEELENVIINYNNKKVNFYLKRNTDDKMCIIGDDYYKEVIKDIMNYFNPGSGFLSTLMLPMFIPLQLKFNLDTFKIEEVYIKNNKIENDLMNEIELDNNLNIKYLIDPIATLDKIDKINDITNDNNDSIFSDTSDKEFNNISKMFDELKGNSDFSGLFQNNNMPDFNNLLQDSDLKSIFSMFENNTSKVNENNKSKKQNNNSFLDNIKNIWTNEYYDAQEELDDFLIKDDNEEDIEGDNEENNDENNEQDNEEDNETVNINLTRYLKNKYDNIFFEICLNNSGNLNEYKNRLDRVINKDEYDRVLNEYKEKLVDEPEIMKGTTSIKSPDGLTDIKVEYDQLIKKQDDEEYLCTIINTKGKIEKNFEYGIPYSKLEKIKKLLEKLY